MTGQNGETVNDGKDLVAGERGTYLSVVVKGAKLLAAQAAADRGIPFAFHHEIHDNPRGSVLTVGRVSVEFKDKLTLWYHEDNTFMPPFKVGSCLVISHHEEGE